MRITEEQMFRVVVIVGVAMIPVVALAALVSPLAGAVLFFAEAGVGAVWLVKRWRAVRPFAAREGQDGSDPSGQPQSGSEDA